MIAAHPDIAFLVTAIEPDLVAWRRHLHAQPELSFKEFETSRFVAERLRSFGGIEVSHVSETGVMGRLRGTSAGPTIALRADIDALPIQEENTFDFVSRAEGVMHACGHDGHTAVLLGVARILADMRDEITGEIRFIFQHAEELPPGGARDFVAAGVMDGVDYVIGCHLLSTIESGQAAVTVGPAMAAADMFSLTIRGKGGHGGFPHETIDPIAITSQVITNLQHIVARQTDPLQSVVVSTTRIVGGTADNVIPGSVDLGGTVRTFSATTRASTRAALERVIEGVTGAHGATATFDYRVGYDAVVNDAGVAAVVADAIRAELGADGLADVPPIMGGDDFSAYLQHTPGAYFFVGTRSETAGSTFQHHHSRFTIDERSLRTAVGVFLRSVATLLHRAPLDGG
jgi:amidohydrolase